MDNILIFNNGTFGDGSITETIIKELRHYIKEYPTNKYKIIYVTNQASTIPNGIKPDHIFDFPEFILNDPLLGPADSDQSIIEFMFKNMSNVKTMFDLAGNGVEIIKNMYEKYKPVCAIYNFSFYPFALRAEF
jgi:hypothetical protein